MWLMLPYVLLVVFSLVSDVLPIGLHRDVWIAAIASSRTRLATLTGAMCKTSQCELRSLRVNSGMVNVIRIVTYYTLPPLESPDSFWIAMAISRQRPIVCDVLCRVTDPSLASHFPLYQG